MMNRRQFDRCVARVMESLPEAFAPYLDNLVVDVEDEADEATLRDVGISDDDSTGRLQDRTSDLDLRELGWQGNLVVAGRSDDLQRSFL